MTEQDLKKELLDNLNDCILPYWRVKRSAVRIKRPIYASILAVIEMLKNIVLGSCSHIKILLAAGCTISRRKAPKKTTVKYSAFWRIGVKTVIPVATAVKTAIRTVGVCARYRR